MAPINVKDEIEISSDQQAIWTLLTDISSWSRWSRLIKRAVVYGPVKTGTEFKCLIRKWDFDGVLSEAAPINRIDFDLKSSGLQLCISCEIVDQANAFKTRANIKATGWITVLFRRKVERTLTDDLFTWLYALKNTLERGSGAKASEKHNLTKPKHRFTLPGPLSFLFKQKDD